jgi:hypothetical protein
MHFGCQTDASVTSTLTLSVAVSAMNTLLSGTPRSCAAICGHSHGSVCSAQDVSTLQLQLSISNFTSTAQSAPGQSWCAGPAPSPRRRGSPAPCHPCRLHSTTQPVLRIVHATVATAEHLSSQLASRYSTDKHQTRAESRCSPALICSHSNSADCSVHMCSCCAQSLQFRTQCTHCARGRRPGSGTWW